MSGILVFGFLAVYFTLLLPRPRTCAVIAFVVIGWCAVDAAVAGQFANAIGALVTAAAYGSAPLAIASLAPPNQKA